MPINRDDASYYSLAKQLATLTFISLAWLSSVGGASASSPEKADFVVSWPAKSSAAAVTFNIPREYLHESTTFLNKDGTVKSFAVLFELPGPKPLKARPFLKGKKGTPQYEAFMRRWQGRFAMDVSQAGSSGGAIAQSMRRQMKNSAAGYYRDGAVAGLERYSRTVCLDTRFKNEALAKAVANKGADDKSPPGCVMNRRSIVLISPESNGAADQVGIDCMTTGCKMYFDAVGRSASIGIAHKDIKNWSRIKKAGQGLAQKFVAY